MKKLSQPIHLIERFEKSLSNHEMERLAQSGESISQREILPKTNNSIKGNGVDRKLTQTNKAIPPTKEEINRLAKAWCEILLGQVMEEQNQEELIGANSGKTAENINRGRKQKRTPPLQDKSPFQPADCST